MVGPRLLLHDARRVVDGSAALLKYLFTRDRVDIGLAQLSTASAAAARGGENRYDVTITNARPQASDVTLSLDIYAVDPPPNADGHYAYFVKRLNVPPRASTHVEIHYDWLTNAGFLVHSLPSPPDHLWRGTLDRPAWYSVNAILLDPGGKRLDLVTVYQQLTT
jgi:hypothetical protein